MWVDFYRLEDRDSRASKSFFTEIVASISDMKFSKDGRYILSRDYMNLKVFLLDFYTLKFLSSCICDVIFMIGEMFIVFSLNQVSDNTLLQLSSFIAPQVEVILLQYHYVGPCVILQFWYLYHCSPQSSPTNSAFY